MEREVGDAVSSVPCMSNTFLFDYKFSLVSDWLNAYLCTTLTLCVCVYVCVCMDMRAGVYVCVCPFVFF